MLKAFVLPFLDTLGYGFTWAGIKCIYKVGATMSTIKGKYT